MMKRDNRGLTLLEVLIAFTLLGIVSGILLGFMTAGGNMYRKVSTNVNVQMQSQVVAAQIKEYIIDCNGSITFGTNTGAAALTINNTKKDGTPEKHEFVWDSATKTIEYNTALLANNVEAFVVTCTSDGVVNMTLTLNQNGKEYTTTQAITLRNQGVGFAATP